MKILLIAPTYPPYNQGGGGVVYQTLAHKLSERGHEVTVIAGYMGKLSRKSELELQKKR
jgi:glycogen synthase